ncbi:MAG: M20/M25/M40 family metallo-hydrolase, partial [Candidatus Altiarchaeota archaeon]|nr:M20/M25/M40 family metallo-hydrolase [Candidatus Altiarchaeota archaeon]
VLEDYGYKVNVDAQGNVLAARGKGEGFLLNSHMDTVPAVGWRINPFNPVVKGGRLYGRGATDCKSGVACMMEIAANAASMKLGKRLYFTFSAKEEAGNLESNGSYKMVGKVKAKRGIILEPSVRKRSVSIVFGCKGIYRSQVDVIGKSAHSGSPWRGVNPIYQLPGFIEKFQSMKKTTETVNAYGKKFKIISVSSITQACAMEGANVIPGRCSLTVDYRTIPGESKNAIKSRIRTLCDKSFGRYSISDSSFYPSEYCIDEKFYDYCCEIISRHGFKPQPKFSNGRNDMTIFKKHGGIKCFSIGPGTLGQLHKNPEYVDLKSFLHASAMIEDLVFSYCSK